MIKSTPPTPVTESELIVQNPVPAPIPRPSLALIILALVLLAFLASLLAYRQFKAPAQVSQITETVKTPGVSQLNTSQLVSQRRSVDHGLIDRGLTGKAIDVNTGRVVTAATVFSPSDRTVYLELDLNQAPKGTIIDYIRYKEGRYVDHGELALAQADLQNILFNWTITKVLSGVRDGRWRIATYANGILAKRIDYEIKADKVSYVYPETLISPTDPDYYYAH